jgi:hypothetical protein
MNIYLIIVIIAVLGWEGKAENPPDNSESEPGQGRSAYFLTKNIDDITLKIERIHT